MELPALHIGDLTIERPIVLGGMGVGVSKAGLAAAVSAAGGLGVIASVGLGTRTASKDCYEEDSSQALLAQIRQVKQKRLPVGINIMVALSNYKTLVEACVKGGADVIVSGAGLPLRLPQYTGDAPIKLVPIVSSGRAAELVCSTWRRKYGRTPDAVVVEGPLAGGHLGFRHEELVTGTAPSLEELVTEVRAVLVSYEQDAGRAIPVIAAGGVFTGADIARFIRLGASAVQMATRFVGTVECDASKEYQQAFLDAGREDILLVKSPVGMTARVLKNEFVERSMAGEKQRFTCPYRCLISCEAGKANYCIAEALVNSAEGDMTHGFAMCGDNAWRVNKIVPVADLMQELTDEATAQLQADEPPAAG